MGATNTIIKIIFIATAVTLVMYGLQDMRVISNTLSGIVKIINKIPMLSIFSSYIEVFLSAIYGIFSMLYDTISIYGMPDIPKHDTYYM